MNTFSTMVTQATQSAAMPMELQFERNCFGYNLLAPLVEFFGGLVLGVIGLVLFVVVGIGVSRLIFGKNSAGYDLSRMLWAVGGLVLLFVMLTNPDLVTQALTTC